MSESVTEFLLRAIAVLTLAGTAAAESTPIAAKPPMGGNSFDGYPGVSEEDLFTAWAKALSGLPKVGDLRMYTGMDMARSADLPHWRIHDSAVLKDYTNHGGVGVPDRPRVANPAVEFPRK